MSNTKNTGIVENITIIYKKIPQGAPKADETFAIQKETLDLDAVEIPAENGVLLRTLYITIDPYMRNRMQDPKIPSYISAFESGSPMVGGVIAEVLRSNVPTISPGDIVQANTPWKSYVVTQHKDSFHEDITVIKNARTAGIPLPYYLGVLGMSGLTAYSGLLDIGKPKSGETLYVSSAAGAVGQVVGQIGKILGLYVVGSAG
ncbi:alcohol dehydrogenase, partial [Piptocephalis cylindrospora]